MLYILSGADDFSLNESLARIKEGLGDKSLLSANTTLFDGQRVTPEQLGVAAETVPFLAKKRLVIATGLLGRFQPRGRSGGKKETPPANLKGDCESFIRCLTKLPDSTGVVLVDCRVSQNNPLFKGLSPLAEVKTFPLLKRDRLAQWIKRRVGEEGGDISPPAIGLLAKLVGGNLWIMAGEVRKLVLYTSGHLIGEDDVKAVVSYAQQANVFAMVDAILEFRVRQAEWSLEQLLRAGVAPSYLLFMLVRQVRLILRARELRGRGSTEREIQNALGLASDFALRKTLEQAASYSLGRLKEIYGKLLEADLSIKTGRRDGELALNILAAELCQRR